ncbi:hypothetical protein LSM04_000638 [Trypanosoma melophagium]|uniref:uncharacterized protein n=1 Tax=Trypanosoma melophagium TaxID=715481 RepID=UPI00351A4999|nr:hypothetical protein LSM04_000638 [Trypanosoma melophagium]
MKIAATCNPTEYGPSAPPHPPWLCPCSCPWSCESGTSHCCAVSFDSSEACCERSALQSSVLFIWSVKNLYLSSVWCEPLRQVCLTY